MTSLVWLQPLRCAMPCSPGARAVGEAAPAATPYSAQLTDGAAHCRWMEGSGVFLGGESVSGPLLCSNSGCVPQPSCARGRKEKGGGVWLDL